MDTKLKSDIAESAAVTALLRHGFKVLKPVGDRLPYDLALDINGHLIKIQVKSAWERNSVYIVDSRRTKTNRHLMLRQRYSAKDFDFAMLYIEDIDIFYIMPVDVFNSYKSEITLTIEQNRQREPKSSLYRERWDLFSTWADKSAMTC
ncbi:MAG: endonuclease [Candidatus Melainabacteria bacterium]|nr:endonuclease [Candidatus Melainabacteria bacterium]MBI3307945.1 endonuclease [Candidatus Melainabacteria bacterium]